MSSTRWPRFVVLVLACIIGGGEARSEVWTGTAAMVRARHFWVGWAVTSHHEYQLVVWHPGAGDQFPGTRVIVRRQSHDDSRDVLIEDVHVSRDAFRIDDMRSGFTMVFEATLPRTGQWRIRIEADEPAKARVAGGDGFTFIASDAVLVGQESVTTGQIAGGDGTGFLGGSWGWDGTGVAHLTHPIESVPAA